MAVMGIPIIVSVVSPARLHPPGNRLAHLRRRVQPTFVHRRGRPVSMPWGTRPAYMRRGLRCCLKSVIEPWCIWLGTAMIVIHNLGGLWE